MEDYNFLDYILDNKLLEPQITWANADKITSKDLSIMKGSYYSSYKRYCKENNL